MIKLYGDTVIASFPFFSYVFFVFFLEVEDKATHSRQKEQNVITSS